MVGERGGGKQEGGGRQDCAISAVAGVGAYWSQPGEQDAESILPWCNKRGVCRRGGSRLFTVFREDLPVHSIVAARLQECNVGLADAHVVWRGVVVQLLVPVLRDVGGMLSIAAQFLSNMWVTVSGVPIRWHSGICPCAETSECS